MKTGFSGFEFTIECLSREPEYRACNVEIRDSALVSCDKSSGDDVSESQDDRLFVY